MRKKPLLKDAWNYAHDNYNWLLKWYDDKTGLHISKLAHLPLFRLTLWDHTVNEYVHYEIDTLLYFPDCKTLQDIHNHPCFTSLPERELKDMFKYKWEEEE